MLRALVSDLNAAYEVFQEALRNGEDVNGLYSVSNFLLSPPAPHVGKRGKQTNSLPIYNPPDVSSHQNSRTYLHEAAKRGNAAMVGYLVDHNASINAVDDVSGHYYI